MKGEARNDIGQMAIVSGVAGSQVEISYRGPTGIIKTRRKQRGSLIRIEEGIEVTGDADGWPVIRQVRDRNTAGQDGIDRIVSSEDEGRAQ